MSNHVPFNVFWHLFKLANKLLNAGRFALSFELPSGVTEVTEPIDQAMLAALRDVIESATKAFDGYDHTKALETTETFFWTFTDDYLELVKERAYGNSGQSAQEIGSAVIALREALAILVRLFAPFIPFAAEEVWSWWQQGSVHLSPWPQSNEIKFQDPKLMKVASEALVQIRKSKSDSKLSMKAEIKTATLSGSEELSLIGEDLKSVGKIAELKLLISNEMVLSDLEFASEE
jgi:valyl-tRNA synthetase